MSSSFVISSSSFLARPRMYFSESVVAMAYGVPAMLTLTLFTMVFSPFLSCICTAQGRLFCILPGFGTVPGNVSVFGNVSMEFPAPLLPELLPEKRFAVQFYFLL